MSHGIPRTRQSKEAIEARKLKEKAKLDAYLALTEDVLSRKKSQDWSKEAFDLTTRLLQINPEVYTIWNYRRNIMTHGLFPPSTPEAVNEYLSAELDMTMAALKGHPKVYWIWNHRNWCLGNVPPGPGAAGQADAQGWRQANWDRELYVVEKMLDADARNFMAWNYRRYVLASMPAPRPAKAELAYTTRKIEANFSNFSAWHQRTKVLGALWASGELDRARSQASEFELVKNAMWSDPADQSAWLYHRWLIGAGEDPVVLNQEIEGIRELLEEQPDSKWCMESLVHYHRLLLPSLTEEEKRQQTIADCIKWLETLKSIDPMRRRRYEEIAQSMAI